MGANTPRPCPNPPSPLFHGTIAELVPGDVLLPGIEVKLSRGQWVWLTPDERSARSWGFCAANDREVGEDAIRVYEVEPLHEVQEARHYHRTKAARVVRQVV